MFPHEQKHYVLNCISSEQNASTSHSDWYLALTSYYFVGNFLLFGISKAINVTSCAKWHLKHHGHISPQKQKGEHLHVQIPTCLLMFAVCVVGAAGGEFIHSHHRHILYTDGWRKKLLDNTLLLKDHCWIHIQKDLWSLVIVHIYPVTMHKRLNKLILNAVISWTILLI